MQVFLSIILSRFIITTLVLLDGYIFRTFGSIAYIFLSNLVLIDFSLEKGSRLSVSYHFVLSSTIWSFLLLLLASSHCQTNSRLSQHFGQLEVLFAEDPEDG